MTRSFTARERELLLYLVADNAVLRAQVDAATLVAVWFEGSQSFDIDVRDGAPLDPTPPTMSDGRRVGPGCLVYALGQPHEDENYEGEIFLWIIDGKIDSLEYPWVTDEMPDHLPAMSQLSNVRP